MYFLVFSRQLIPQHDIRFSHWRIPQVVNLKRLISDSEGYREKICVYMYIYTVYTCIMNGWPGVSLKALTWSFQHSRVCRHVFKVSSWGGAWLVTEVVTRVSRTSYLQPLREETIQSNDCLPTCFWNRLLFVQGTDLYTHIAYINPMLTRVYSIPRLNIRMV